MGEAKIETPEDLARRLCRDAGVDADEWTAAVIRADREQIAEMLSDRAEQADEEAASYDIKNDADAVAYISTKAMGALARSLAAILKGGVP